jgi:alpha-beta hydrolase superfamily lysophospholipase
MATGKTKLPFALRFIRWGFPRLEMISPGAAARLFRYIFFTPLRYPLPEKEKEMAARAEKFMITVKGKKIQGYRWMHDGPAVLLVHGWAGRATQFRKFIPALHNAGYSVVAFDGPAHGGSEGKSTNIIEFSDALKKLFENESNKPVAAITHSFGGVATLYSVMTGLPLTTVVNIASPSIGDDVVSIYLRAIKGSAPTGEAFKKHILATYGKTFDEFSSLHFVKHFPRPVRLMIVQDDADPEVSMEHATELQKAYPSARLLATQGLGHTRILKEDAVISATINFISGRS